MAKRWVRGPTPTKDAGANNYYQVSLPMTVLLYYTFRYLLGYQFIEDGIAGGGNFTDCTQSSALADGTLTNTDFTFTVATGTPFSVGTDEGKMILIVDPTNPENCGIHEILTVNSTTQVVLDWYSTDFPTAAAGTLDWYLIDVTAVSQVNDGDFFVFQVNHATVPWQIACTCTDASGDDRIRWEIAPEASSWDTVTHAWKTTAPVHSRALQPSMGYYNDATAPRLYVYGDTDGSALWVMMHRLNGTSSKYYANIFVLDPLFETTPAHSARDKLVVCGMTSSSGPTGDRDGSATEGIGYGSVWVNDPYYKSTVARWCGWYDTSEYFKRTFTSPNHRDGAEFDGLPIWVQADADVSENPQWSILGALPTTHIFLAACNGIGDMILFGSNLFMHWTEGIVTPWPGFQHT